MASPLPASAPGAPQRGGGSAADAKHAHRAALALQAPHSKSSQPHGAIRFMNAPASLVLLGGASAYVASQGLGAHTVIAADHLGDRLGIHGGNRIVVTGLILASGLIAAAAYSAKP